MSKTWLDCNGTQLKPGDICKFSPATIEEQVEQEDTMLLREKRRDLWSNVTFTIEHLLENGNVYCGWVEDTSQHGEMEPSFAEFISRPEQVIE